MTDVLIVCVRDDEVQAKALADLFEREQMSVGGAPADDGALRGSGAVVILWSQASIRSRPFLDAAQRAVNAGKAVVACLIDAPPASSLNQSPCFDLRDWSGSPDDPMIDPLYFAVDRMVNAQRAANPAPEQREQHRAPARAPSPAAYAAPPPYARARPTPPAQPPRHEPRHEPRYEPQAYAPPPQPAPESHREPPRARRMAAPATPDAADPVSAEALRWKAIRHSRDPAAFLHYLAEYGADGAFSELAELRLKQLQESNATPLKAAARAAASETQRRAQPAPAPEPIQLPPQMPAPRREPPAARREPPPEHDYAREPAPARAAPERDYATYPPLRGSRSGGGVARVLLLALLLGGGALGAGFYFANGQQMLGAGGEPAFAAIEEQQQPALEETAIEDPPFIAPESAVGGPIEESEPVSVARPAAAPDPRAEARRAEAARTPRFEPVAEPESTQLMPRPISPAPTQLAAIDPGAVRGPIVAPGAVVWVSRASAQQFSDHYPSSARRAGVAGRVQLSCSITGDLSPNCSVLSETPQGYGFGQAALRVSRSFRARNTLDDGSPAAGANANLNFTFRPAE